MKLGEENPNWEGIGEITRLERRNAAKEGPCFRSLMRGQSANRVVFSASRGAWEGQEAGRFFEIEFRV